MTEAPERIWVWNNEPNGEPVVSYPDQPYPSGAVEYTRARPMTVAEAAKLLLAENVERGLAKSMAHFVSVKEWEGYKRGVQAYTERLRAMSQGGE